MIRLLNRYIIRQLSIYTIYTLLALLSLYLFFDFMSEIRDVGDGSYTMIKAIQYLIMLMPSHAYELMPLAILIGGLLTLSYLSSDSELVVIRTCGMSLKSLIIMMLQFGFIFTVITALLGEWLIPIAEQKAEQFKLEATHDTVSAGNRSGIWIKQGNDIINVKEMLPDTSLHHINIYRYNNDFQLEETMYADSGLLTQAQSSSRKNTNWYLQNVYRTQLTPNRTLTSHFPHMTWPISINQQLLSVLLIKPDQMSIKSLYEYIHYLKDNHQQTTRYELAGWRKLFYPLACLVMALVALAFTPQQNRKSNIGLKLFFGIALGLIFHFAGRFLGFTSLLYGIPPLIAAISPTILFFLLAIGIIRYQEKR